MAILALHMRIVRIWLFMFLASTDWGAIIMSKNRRHLVITIRIASFVLGFVIGAFAVTFLYMMTGDL